MKLKNIFHIFSPLILSLLLSYFNVTNPIINIIISTLFLFYRIYVGYQYYYEDLLGSIVLYNAFLILGAILYLIKDIFNIGFLERISPLTSISSSISFEATYLLGTFLPDTIFNKNLEITCFFILAIFFTIGHIVGLKISTRGKYTFDKNLFAQISDEKKE